MSSESSSYRTPRQGGNSYRLTITSGVALLCAVGLYVLIVRSAVNRIERELANGRENVESARSTVELRSEVTKIAESKVAGVWPNLFGPMHDSSAEEEVSLAWGPQGPSILWEIPVGEGYSSPIVWQDRLIVMHRIGDEEIIACHDSQDGSPLWEHRTPTSFECKSHYTDGPYSTPTTDGEFVFGMSAEGLLQCLKLSDGSLVWEKDLRSEYALPTDRTFGEGHSPLIWGEKLIINVGGTIGETGIIAFDKKSGNVLWSATDHRAGYATPQPARIHAQDFLFVLTDAGIVSLDPEDGTVHWEIPFKAPVVDAENAVTPLIHGDIAIFCSYGNGTKCLRILEDGSYEELWTDRRALTSQFSPLICVDKHVYGVHAGDFSLRCIELTSGKVCWREKTELKRATSLRVGHQLILFGEYGHLASVAVDPAEFRVLSRTEQSLFDDTHCFSAPALAAGRLYLRNEHKLVCYDVTE